MCRTPIVIWGLGVTSIAFVASGRWKKWCLHDPLLVSAATVARWQQPVASVVALNHLYQAMCVVLYRCVTMAIETARWCGTFFDCCFVCCCDVNTHLMVASSGFSYSPGHSPSGDAPRIAPAHHHGYQNCWRTMCFVSYCRFLLTINVA
jgi:hypothetical protein